MRTAFLAALAALVLASSGAAAAPYSLKIESRRDGHVVSVARLGDLVELAVSVHGRPYEICVAQFGRERCYRSARPRVAWQVASGNGAVLRLRVGGRVVASASLRATRAATLFRSSGFPVWSPDARRVAFDTWDGRVNIEVGDVEGALRTRRARRTRTSSRSISTSLQTAGSEGRCSSTAVGERTPRRSASSR
jgi:hypothetical protein